MTIHILNVDDNDGGRYVKTRILQRAGFTVSEATTGEEALRLVAANQPVLILLDVKLPDISGYEICRRLKGDPTTASIMVLQTSASFVDSQHSVRGLEEGADAYLTEPVQPEELVATVQALLRLRQAEMELRQGRDILEARVRERTAELERAIAALQKRWESVRSQNRRCRRRISSSRLLWMLYRHTFSSLTRRVPFSILMPPGSVSWRPARSFPAYGRGMGFAEFFTQASCADAVVTQDIITGVREVLIGQRETFFYEYACQTHAEPRWFLVRVTRLDGAGGRQAVVVLENITEVKQAEEALRRQQEVLYQSEKLATMGALLASVAHELNNPLGVIQMQLDLLGEEAQDLALQERVAEMQQVRSAAPGSCRALRYAGSLVNDLLGSSSSEARDELAVDAGRVDRVRLGGEELGVPRRLAARTWSASWSDPRAPVGLVTALEGGLEAVEDGRQVAGDRARQLGMPGDLAGGVGDVDDPRELALRVLVRAAEEAVAQAEVERGADDHDQVGPGQGRPARLGDQGAVAAGDDAATHAVGQCRDTQVLDEPQRRGLRVVGPHVGAEDQDRPLGRRQQPGDRLDRVSGPARRGRPRPIRRCRWRS